MKKLYNTLRSSTAYVIFVMVMTILLALWPVFGHETAHVPETVVAPIVVSGPSATMEPAKTPQRIVKDINCLARNIYHEARGENLQSMIAVGAVTLNRVSKPGFPASICGVVNQSVITAAGVRTCQFTWMCQDQLRTHLPTGSAWDQSLHVAKELIRGQYIPERLLVHDAKYFHNLKVDPGWTGKRSLIAEIGNHAFYR